ncbi:MAG: hypothetical protein LLG04_16770 [Parachlamydia sp.]|nr:hypothetical protein [Parachlamydia sp.]
MERKIKKKHIDYSCGFPVVLLNVPLVKVHDSWIPDINYDALAQTVLLSLAKKNKTLTGNEIRFIRYYFDLNVRDFAHRFGVKHPSVVKWEGKKDLRADITWGIEKDIRLFILDKLCRSHKEFRESYQFLEEIREDEVSQPLILDIHDDLE